MATCGPYKTARGTRKASKCILQHEAAVTNQQCVDDQLCISQHRLEQQRTTLPVLSCSLLKCMTGCKSPAVRGVRSNASHAALYRLCIYTAMVLMVLYPHLRGAGPVALMLEMNKSWYFIITSLPHDDSSGCPAYPLGTMHAIKRYQITVSTHNTGPEQLIMT